MARFNQGLRDVANMLKLKGRNDRQANLLLLLQSWLRDERNGKWLVVLDNVDDARFLVETPAESHEAHLAQRRFDYFPSSDQGSLLITSRIREEALRLAHSSQIISVEAMSEHLAERLLEKKLGQPNPDNKLLASALEYMPLAISQAVAYIQEMGSLCSIRDYCDRLEESRKSRTSLLQRNNKDPNRDKDASNSILLTWQISFNHIDTTRKSAAKLLSLMSFCDRVAMPEMLLLADLQKTRLPASP